MKRHSFHKLCGNCAFPQNVHTRKVGEITVFYAVIFCTKYTAPLFELLKKGKELIWTENCESGFNFMKNELENLEKPAHLQFVCLFLIYRDASGKAIGFVLV